MTKYLKNDFKWDFGNYSSNINIRIGSVSDSIKKFLDCIEHIEAEKQKEIEEDGIEIIQEEGEIDQELIKSLSQLMTNLQNGIFYNSLLITTYSFLEYSLTEYCRMMENYILKDIGSYYSYNGNGIDKTRDYLREAFEIDIAENKEWSALQSYKKVRNLISHNDGNIIKDNSKTREEQPDFKEINKIAEIEITSTGYIHIQDIEYVKSLLNISIDFIQKMVDTTNERVKE